mgnify:CR=1 FL=1
MSHTILYGSIAALVALVLIWRFSFWYGEGRKLVRDGYLPPNPTFFGQLALRSISKLMCKLFVGPIKVIDRSNARFNGRLNILPNHQFPLDFMVVASALPYGYRHLGTVSEMKNPLRATLSAFAGFFAVNTEGGKAQSGGQAVVEACGKCLGLHRKSRLLMFPQGKLVQDNVLRPEDFRTGAIRAMHAARDHFGCPTETLAVLPMAVHYKRDPKDADWFHKLVVALGWKSFRKFKYYDETATNYGAVVVIGRPIPLADLPEDPREAIEVVRQEIDKLLTVAKSS